MSELWTYSQTQNVEEERDFLYEKMVEKKEVQMKRK